MRNMACLLVLVLSFCVSFGECFAGEIDAAEYWQDATNGNPISQFYLAYGYTYGVWGLEKDAKEASYWLNKAVEQENLDAKCLMGSKFLKQSKELLNSEDDETRKLGLETYTTGRTLLENAARLGHPTAFMAISPLFAGEGKYVMALAWILFFQQRMHDFAALVENTEPLRAMLMQKMTEEEILKAQADAEYLDQKVPIYLPEDYYIDWPQGERIFNESEIKKLTADGCEMFRELVKVKTVSQPAIKLVNRSDFASRLRGEFAGSPDFQNMPQKSYDQAVNFALSRIGYYFSTGELLIAPGTISVLFARAGIEKEKFPSYFKLFIIGEIARKYFAEQIKLVSENDKRNYEARRIVLESLIQFCQLRLSEALGCDKNLVKSGLFFYHTKFPENADAMIQKTFKPGLRFLNYLNATFSEEDLWNVGAYLPQTISEIKQPEQIKSLFNQTVATTDEKGLLANAVKEFEAKNYHQAKAILRSILFSEPLHGQARFILAVINAREKEYSAAWINSSIAKQSLATDQKLTSFIKKLKTIASGYYCEF